MTLGGSNTLLTMAEAAARLRYSYVYFSQHHKEWGIRSIRIGNKILFRERELEAFIERRAA